MNMEIKFSDEVKMTSTKPPWSTNMKCRRQKACNQFVEAKEAYESTDQEKYLATGNMLLTVYAEAKSNIPFNGHNNIVTCYANLT